MCGSGVNKAVEISMSNTSGRYLTTMSCWMPGDHQATIKNQNDDNQFCIFVALEGVTRVKCVTLNSGKANDKEATIHNAGNRNE
jgi:hypothetical protein